MDGRIDGYASLPNGSRYLLVAHPTGLEFYDVPSLLQVTLSLSAVANGESVTVGGAVSRTTEGDVQLYFETPSTADVGGDHPDPRGRHLRGDDRRAAGGNVPACRLPREDDGAPLRVAAQNVLLRQPDRMTIAIAAASTSL